jgi:predicted TIM-barrel fold metal-dependent hydrolase
VRSDKLDQSLKIGRHRYLQALICLDNPALLLAFRSWEKWRADASHARLGARKRVVGGSPVALRTATLAALMKLVPTSQTTFGSDYPYFPLNQIEVIRQMGLAPADVHAIERGNAARLVPRLASS